MSQTLSDIKTLLARHGLHPKHRLGQNFLHDAHAMARVVEAAGVEEGQVILEVGPGTGALSEHLLEAGGRLVMVELDAAMEPILEERLARFRGRWKLIVGDALASKHTLNPAIHEALRDIAASHATANNSAPPTVSLPSSFKLVANLPYQIASPLVVNLLLDAGEPRMSDATVMVQREVADRLTAGPGSKQYGPLSVMVQALAQPKRVATVPAGCFWPMPKVESAVVTICRRDPPLTDHPAALAKLVHKLFTQRRKQLGTILGRAGPWPAGVWPDQRPEELAVEQWITLAGLLDAQGRL